MSKIIVEDYTQPAEPQDLVTSLSSSIFISAAQLGRELGMTDKDITLALFSSAENMSMFMQIVGAVSPDELLEFRKEALQRSLDKRAKMETDGTIQTVKDMYEENNVKEEPSNKDEGV